MIDGIVTHKDFIPYTLDDFGVIIPHPSRYPERWKWFWPRYKASVPEETIKNTVVVFHNRDQVPIPIPDNVKNCGAKIIDLPRAGHSIVWPTVEGLKYLKTRIVARICDDTDFESNNWVEKALELFNQKPHFKILASLTLGGPSFSQLEQFCHQAWFRKLLNNGDFRGMEFCSPSNWIANRPIWMGYYFEMDEYTSHGLDDVLFTLLSRADATPIIRFNYFIHRGAANQDKIVEG